MATSLSQSSTWINVIRTSNQAAFGTLHHTLIKQKGISYNVSNLTQTKSIDVWDNYFIIILTDSSVGDIDYNHHASKEY